MKGIKKNTFLTAIGVLIVISGIAYSAPPQDKPTDVNVTNTPNVNIVNTPTIKLDNNSNVGIIGTTDVNITNKATVNVESGNITIGNQETNPVPVKITGGAQNSMPTFYKYSVRFACKGADYPIAYKTRISIHNPQSNLITISRTIIKSLAIDQTSVPPRQLDSYDIQSDNALEITCDTMQNMGEIDGNPTTGFLVINSSKPINVVGTYLTLNDALGGSPVSSDVEVISPIPIY